MQLSKIMIYTQPRQVIRRSRVIRGSRLPALRERIWGDQLKAAFNEYKRRSGRMFPTWSEVIEATAIHTRKKRLLLG